MTDPHPENAKTVSGQARRASLVFRNTLSRASSATVAQILAIATIPLLLDKVTAAEFGIYTLGAAFVGYFSLLSLPARAATFKFVAEYGENDIDKIREFASSTMLVNLGVGVIMAGILATIAHFCQELFVIEDELVGKAKIILYAYACAAPISQPLTVFGSILYGIQDYRPTSVLDVVGAIVRTVTIFCIYFFDGSILWLVFQELFFEIARNILLGILLSRRYGISGFNRNLVKLVHLKKVFGYGGWSISYVLSSMLIYQGTRILVGVFVSVAAIAYFQIAYMLYNIVNSVSRYMQSAVLPASSSAIVDGDHDFIEKLLIRGTRSSLCVLLPLVLCVVMLAEPILNNWISPEYGREATLLSQILVSAWFFQAWLMTAVEIYRGQSDIRDMSVLVMIGALCQIVLAIVLMRIYGVTGAAISTVIYYIVISPLQVRLASRKIGFSITWFVTRSVIPVYGVVAIIAVLLYAGIRYIGEPVNASQTIVSLFIVYVLSTLVLFSTIAREEGRMILGKLLLIFRYRANR